MPSDCYEVFKKTYNQAVADGLATAVATAAAQSAMDACLNLQNSRPTTVAQPNVTVKSGRIPDQGPVVSKGIQGPKPKDSK